MYAVTTSCVILLLFGQTEALVCRTGAVGAGVQEDSCDGKCSGGILSGVKTYGCIPSSMLSQCDKNNICCCSTDRCNDASFANNCGSVTAGGSVTVDGSAIGGSSGGGGDKKPADNSSAGVSINQNIFILLGVSLLAYKLA